MTKCSFGLLWLSGVACLSSDALRDPVVQQLARLGFGRTLSVTNVTPKRRSAGASTRQLRYETAEGPVFCKVNSDYLTGDAFIAEAASLRALRAASMGAGILRVPTVLGTGALPLGGAYMLCDWVPLTEPADEPAALRLLGTGLAALHSTPQPPGLGTGFGFAHDTRLGGYEQPNRWSTTMADFFVEQRLAPLLRAAARGVEGLDGDDLWWLRSMAEPTLESATRQLDVLPDPPALLHGNLWAGSCGWDTQLRPVLYDPASWYGLPEFDLALLEVRGRLGNAFYDGYHELRPRESGFEERRRIFTLYHLLLELSSAGSEGSAARFNRVFNTMKDIASSEHPQ